MSQVKVNTVAPCLCVDDVSAVDWVDVLSSSQDPSYSIHPRERLQRQVELESCMRAEGLIHQDNEVRKAREKETESRTSYGRVLLTNYTHRLALAIEEQLQVVKQGKPGCSNNNLRYIKDLEPHVISYITLKTVVDLITRNTSLQNMAKVIGVNLEDECRCRFFEAKAKEAYKMAMYKERYCNTLFRKRAAISAMMGNLV